MKTAKLWRLARETFSRGNEVAAAAACERILKQEPRNAQALHMLGLVAARAGELALAQQFLEHALESDATRAVVWNCLGEILLASGKVEDAELAFRAALKRDGRFADAYFHLGEIWERLDRAKDAAAAFQDAVRCRPEWAEAQSNLGTMLRKLGRPVEAEPWLRKAVTLMPGFYHAQTQLGSALKEQGKYREAIALYCGLLREHNRDAELHYNLANALQQAGESSVAIASYEQALALDAGHLRALSNLLYIHATTRDISPQAEKELAVKWERAALTDAERAEARERRFVRAPGEARKLRIGIVSAELGEHAVSEFLEPVLENLDRERFHRTLFPTSRRNEARSARMEALGDAVAPLTLLRDAEAAAFIREQEIDLLIDTTGHTANCRLGIFAHRAAPVQVSYIGYFSTTGLTEMDWVFADDGIPKEYDRHFCEGVWRLPRFANCYRGDATLPESGWKPDPSGTIWLGSFNRYNKISDATLDLWAKVLLSIPRAKFLLEDRHPDEGDAQERILSGFDARRVARERVEFEPFVPGHERHMRLYDRLDIALDTIPYNSGTTACDALWMGAPVVALEGFGVIARMAAGYVRASGHPEWVAKDEDEYVRIVKELAGDVELRKKLRGTQRADVAKSELCDAVGLTRALERAFEGMFDLWWEKQNHELSSMHLTGRERLHMAKRDHRDELGPNSAGQSGDLQGLSDRADADSESVEELIEEGNYSEAAAIEGVEDAPPADEAEVRTRQVKEDDVPPEYRDDSEKDVA